MRRILAAAFLVGCGSGPSSVGTPEPLVFETFSPPQFTSRDVFLAARGDVVVLASRISRDGGATWEPTPLAGAERVAIDGNVVMAFTSSLVRYDVATRALSPVTGAPSYAGARTWRATPSGNFVVFDPVHNAIALETGGTWRTLTLPPPAPGEVDPFITDVESNGETVMAVSAWGLYWSDGTAFTRVLPQSADLGRELVVLSDGSYTLLGGSKTLRFDARGTALGQSAGVAVQTGDAVACDDGAVVALGKVSHDSCTSWQPLLGGGALTLTVERVSCGGGRYWVLGHSPAWGYRLLRFDGENGFATGNWELAGDIAWGSNGPPIVRTADGTFISAGLAWHEGDAAWSLREVPATTWVAGPTLFGMANKVLYTSDDTGRSWRGATTTGLEGEPEAFARDPQGALYASRFSGGGVGLDMWHAQVWRSTDGASWSIAYDGVATREPGKDTVGEAHRFIGITAKGTWIATDAISNDAGVTWTPTEFDGDKSLAFLTPAGQLVTPRDDVWHVFEAGGAGELVGTWKLEAGGQPVPASDLRSVAFDELGYAYVARGAPYVAVWRSTKPIMRD
jgi:hypothetical protein